LCAVWFILIHFSFNVIEPFSLSYQSQIWSWDQPVLSNVVMYHWRAQEKEPLRTTGLMLKWSK